MQSNFTYPAVIDYNDPSSIVIEFPDFPDAYTDVDKTEDFISAAQDILALAIQDRLDRKEALPDHTQIPEIKENQKIVYINIWMPYHRKRVKEIYVKKTLTIPAWLDLLAKENHLPFSAILVKGLKQELGIAE